LDKPLVSIIIPLFNKLDWIPQTINSVVNQTYKNWECIIIDDGSTDGSFELVTSLTENYPGNWRIVRQSNSGQSVARNRGIEISSGKYVALLDADDIWFAEKLSTQVKFLNAHRNVDLLFTSYVSFLLAVNTRNLSLFEPYELNLKQIPAQPVFIPLSVYKN
jgi:glycosyltransferase involved in cell wall biosynthesis